MSTGKFVQADIKEYWPRIKSRVKELTDEMGDNYEDVYACCLFGTASLLVCSDGFLIVQVNKVPFKTHSDFLVWIGSTWETKPEFISHKYFSNLYAIAAEHGCKTITFETKKRGFEKLLPSGWVQTKVIYQKEI